MKNFADSIKYLPNSLKQLVIYLSNNDLGDEIENIEHLVDGIK